MFPSLLTRRPRSSLRTALALRANTPLGHNLLDGLLEFWPLNEPSGVRRGVHAGLHLDEANTVGSVAGVGSSLASNFVNANSEYLFRYDETAIRLGDTDNTICIWVNLASKTADRNIFSKYEITGNQREWMLQYEVAMDQFRFLHSTTGTGADNVRAATFGSPSTGVWYFLVCRYNAGTNTLGISVNAGTEDTFGAANGSFAGTGTLAIGTRFTSNAPADSHDGSLQRAGIWKRLLTSNEIAYLYNNGLGRDYPFSSPLFNSPPVMIGGAPYDLVGRWAKKVVANAGTFESDSVSIANGFIDVARAKSWYPKVRYLLPMLGGNMAAAVVPLLDPFNFGNTANTNFVDADFDQAIGLAGDGIGKFLTLPFNPSELGSTNNGAVGVWLLTTLANTAQTLWGYQVISGTDRRFHLTSFAGGSDPNIFGSWGLQSEGVPAGIVLTSTGFYYLRRASATSRQLFNNGASIGLDTTSDSAPSANAKDISVFCFNNNAGSNTQFLDGTLGLLIADDGSLTDAETLDLYETIRDYLMEPSGKVAP